tara:strand:- start:115 stop:318 length:204 start_codon:yes stop_codon:yes gene_type:complete
MVIDYEVIASSKKRSKANRYFPKWAIYSVSGFSVLILVGLLKALLPVIGMSLLLAYIWSQSTSIRRY